MARYPVEISRKDPPAVLCAWEPDALLDIGDVPWWRGNWIFVLSQFGWKNNVVQPECDGWSALLKALKHFVHLTVRLKIDLEHILFIKLLSSFRVDFLQPLRIGSFLGADGKISQSVDTFFKLSTSESGNVTWNIRQQSCHVRMRVLTPLWWDIGCFIGYGNSLRMVIARHSVVDSTPQR